MNAMTETRGSALAVPEKNFFEQYAEAVSSNRIIGDLLRFNKGDWLSGQDQDELPIGTRLLVNVPEMTIGWVKWVDGKPEEQLMGRVADGFKPARRSELGDTDQEEWETDDDGRPRDPWQLTNYLILKEENGDQLYTLAGSSKGLLTAIGDVSGAYGKRYRMKPNEVPIVELQSDKYKHKVYSWVKVPVLKVVGWTHKSAFDDALAAEAAEHQERSEAADHDEDQDEIPFEAEAPKKGRGKASAASAETQF